MERDFECWKPSDLQGWPPTDSRNRTLHPSLSKHIPEEQEGEENEEKNEENKKQKTTKKKKMKKTKKKPNLYLAGRN